MSVSTKVGSSTSFWRVLADEPKPALPPAPPVSTPALSRTLDVFERPAVQARPSTWPGTVLSEKGLSGKAEKAFLERNGGQAGLLPYRQYDPSRAPVVVVHGVGGSFEMLKSLADRLDASGKQVYFAAFDTTGTEVHENGKQLASAMAGLARDGYASKAKPFDMVCHSMGGIVGRAALNYLQDPNWMGDAAPGATSERDLLGKVRLRSLDTTWDGFVHESEKTPSFVAKTVKWAMDTFGVKGLYEMRGSSDLFKKLYSVTLENADLQNTAARQPGKQDSMRALPDLEAKELLAVARFIATGEAPQEPRTRNMAGGLAQDSRFPALKQAVNEAVRTGRLSLEEPSKASELSRLYDEVMPRAVGSHLGIAQDDPEDLNDPVDRLVSELSTP